MYKNDINLFAKNEKELGTNANSWNIGIEFVTDKSARFIMKSRKI